MGLYHARSVQFSDLNIKLVRLI